MADAREGFIKLLDSLGESCQFATHGSLPPVLPGLDVDEIGTIGLPVSPRLSRRSSSFGIPIGIPTCRRSSPKSSASSASLSK